MARTTYLCDLSAPAKCEYRVDGRMNYTNLCGGCNLYDYVKECPYRISAQIIIEDKE